jgi:hypothetical protein
MSDADTARHLEVEPTRLYQWKTARRPMPAEHLVKLAQLAEEDPVRALGAYQTEQLVRRQERRSARTGRSS